MTNLLQDLRFGARVLLKSPAYALLATASLALGIMATTAMYSVVHAVILDPFPYKNVDELMSVKVWDPGGRGYRTNYTPDQFLEIAERNTIFSGAIASTVSDVLWTGDGEPQRLRGNHITTNTFDVLGVPALIGRTITPADGDPSAEPTVVLGHRFWIRQFGGDKNVLGKRLKLNNTIRTVVGVMPKRFMWRGADVYVPTVYRRGQAVENVRFVHLLGRLKPQVNEAQAVADLKPLIEELQRREPTQFPKQWRVGLLSFRDTYPSSITEVLWILFGAVGLLLLISCANVSNLILSKASSRQKEISVRASLGAPRFRIIRQLLTESLVLALCGGLLGVLLAFGCVKAILALVPPDTIPDEAEVVINLPVLWFTLGVSVLTAIIFGLAPAISSTGDLGTALREAGRGLTRGGRQTIIRNTLVVVEVALSLVLLVSASLMMRTLIKVQEVEAGLRPEQVLMFRVPLPPQRYPDAARRTVFFDELLRRLENTPGVSAVGLNTSVHPMGNWTFRVDLDGSAQQDTRPSAVNQVNEGYGRVVGIRLLRGRNFTATEINAKQRLAIVNEAFERRYAAGADTLGRVLRIPRMVEAPFGVENPTFQIIGVVKDVTNRTRVNEVQPEVFVPYSIAGMAEYIVVSTEAPPLSLANTLRQQVYSIDKDQPITMLQTMERMLGDEVYSQPRFSLVLFGLFAFLGLALATIGVYGLLSNVVAQQTQEIGVRIALGASFGTVIKMVLVRGMALLGIGVAVGLLGSFFATKLLAKQIWNISTVDPISYVLVIALLLFVGLQACFWPARRAARLNPVIALRHE